MFIKLFMFRSQKPMSFFISILLLSFLFSCVFNVNIANCASPEQSSLVPINPVILQEPIARVDIVDSSPSVSLPKESLQSSTPSNNKSICTPENLVSVTKKIIFQNNE